MDSLSGQRTLSRIEAEYLDRAKQCDDILLDLESLSDPERRVFEYRGLGPLMYKIMRQLKARTPEQELEAVSAMAGPGVNKEVRKLAQARVVELLKAHFEEKPLLITPGTVNNLHQLLGPL